MDIKKKKKIVKRSDGVPENNETALSHSFDFWWAAAAHNAINNDNTSLIPLQIQN